MPIRIFHFFEDYIAGLDSNLKFGPNLRLWFRLEPLFGDYGWRGRLVGFLFRTVRLATTLFVYVAAFAIGLAGIVLWYLLLPFAIGLILHLI